MSHPRSPTLRLTTLESRLVPSVEVPSTVVAAPSPQATQNGSLDPAPMLVGTDAQGEAIYTVTVQPGRCNCTACRGLPPADSTPAPATPAVVAEPAPAVAQTQSPTLSVVPTRPLGSDPTPVVPAPAAAVVIAPSDAGSYLIAQPDLSAEVQPYVVSTPTPAAVSIATFAGTGWRWGFADPFADAVELDRSV